MEFLRIPPENSNRKLEMQPFPGGLGERRWPTDDNELSFPVRACKLIRTCLRKVMRACASTRKVHERQRRRRGAMAAKRVPVAQRCAVTPKENQGQREV